MKPKTIIKLAITIALLAGAYFGVREFATTTVSVTPIRRGTITQSATGNVTVIPSAEVKIVAPEKGNLIDFGRVVEGEFASFQEGDTVKKGEVVARLDPGRIPFDLRQLKADLDRLTERRNRGSTHQATLNSLLRNLESARKLRESKHVPEIQVRDLETRIESLKSTMDNELLDLKHSILRTEIQIAQLEDQLDRYSMRSPFDGVIMAPSFVNGDLVFAGNGITKVTSTEKTIKVEINQDDLDTVRSSKRVVVSFFSFPDKNYEGKISYFIPVGNSTTQRFTVFLKMKDLPPGILSGQTGEASFIADERHNTLIAPVSAVTDNAVFVFKDGRLEKRKIKIGCRSFLHVEVTQGLREGELVVARNVEQQRDGDRVTAAPLKN
ncbi:MAG: efflux RND transporter periplasmic adaptor subunit [Puniceicoccales bacterium]|jgi:RND family efflux transporter MFP subunit|nr:efflux RND transporter periplasmic adaptor subunit [Puniceicoccales bacterium]